MLGRLAAYLAALVLWAAPPVMAADELVVTFGGDVNFARSRTAPLPDAVVKFGRYSLEQTTRILAPEWATGDVNFINVETVVAERDGVPQAKTFVFRSHPENFRHLIGLGVNAFALANNHAYDHGWPGLEQTLGFFVAEDQAARPLLYAGTGRGEAAFRPRIAEIAGFRIAMGAASFGSGGYRPTAERVGMAYLDVADHYERVLAGLREADADLKILSLHTGTENQIELNFGQAARFRRAVEEAGVQLVLGHHPHVARGVEVLPEAQAAIFYSLGNLLFIGGAEKDSASLGRDFGLFGKAYFRRDATGLELSALEVLPLKGVHLVPRQMAPRRAMATIEALNRLSRASVGTRAAEFEPRGNRGAVCFGGPYGPRTHDLCCRSERSLHCDLPDLM